MRFLWIMLVVFLSACESSGETSAPSQSSWAKFAGATADDTQGSSVNSCVVNVLTLSNNMLTSQYHKTKADCDCSTVQPSQAATCVGELLASDDSFAVHATVSDFLVDVMRFSSPCPVIEPPPGIPFIPPDCLSGAAESELNRFTTIPAVKFPEFAVGAGWASKALDLNAELIASSKPYVTREGEQALSVTYKNVEKSYSNCELDAQIVFALDASGHLIPARDPSVLSAAENPPELNLVPLEYQLSSPSSQTCAVAVGAAGNANTTGIDNALNPYAGLDAEQNFGPLQDGVLTLDYAERFYKIK